MLWKRFKRWCHLIRHAIVFDYEHRGVSVGYYEIHGPFHTTNITCTCGKEF